MLLAGGSKLPFDGLEFDEDLPGQIAKRDIDIENKILMCESCKEEIRIMEASFANSNGVIEKFIGLDLLRKKLDLLRQELDLLRQDAIALRDRKMCIVEELAGTQRTRGSCYFVIMCFAFTF